MSNSTTLPARSEVPIEQTWDLASVFSMPQDWAAACVPMYPLDSLRLAGIDLTTPEPVEKAFTNLASLVDRLEQLAH